MHELASYIYLFTNKKCWVGLRSLFLLSTLAKNANASYCSENSIVVMMYINWPYHTEAMKISQNSKDNKKLLKYLFEFVSGVYNSWREGVCVRALVMPEDLVKKKRIGRGTGVWSHEEWQRRRGYWVETLQIQNRY